MKFHLVILLLLFTLPSFAETLEPIATLHDYTLWSASDGQALVAEQYDNERYLHNLFIYAVDGEGQWQLYDLGITNVYYYSASIYKKILYISTRETSTALPVLSVYDVHHPNNPKLVQRLDNFFGLPGGSFISDEWALIYSQKKIRLYRRNQDGSLLFHSDIPSKYPRWLTNDYLILMENPDLFLHPEFEIYRLTNEGAQLLHKIDLELPEIDDIWCGFVIEPLIYLRDMIIFMPGWACVKPEPEIEIPKSNLFIPNQIKDDLALGFVHQPFSSDYQIEYRRLGDSQKSNVGILGASRNLLIADSVVGKLVIFSERDGEFTPVVEVSREYPFCLDEDFLYVERKINISDGNTNTIEIYQLPEVPTSHTSSFNHYE